MTPHAEKSYFAATGDQDVDGNGTLLTLVFLATDVMDDFHVHLSDAVFNANMMPQLGSGNINVLALNYGDVNFNDNVQAYDASLILQYLMNYIEFDWAQERLADVTLDSTISALDASVILQYIVELVGCNRRYVDGRYASSYRARISIASCD